MTTSAAAPTQRPQVTEAFAKRTAIAALVGTAMEWYDFFLFTTASAIVFNVQYFQTEDLALATIYSFGTMAVGFVARPIGGIVFGHIGDRIGRKKVLMITIIGIGLVTGLIGLLPNANTIGVWAPIMLIILRIGQGLCVGGEWGGAATAAAEAAPPESRSFWAALPQIGSPIGTLLSSGGFFILGLTVSTEAFDAWGWRVPFVLAIPLLGLAVYVRNTLEESPVFKAAVEGEDVAKEVPIVQLFKNSWREVIVGFMCNLLGLAAFFLVTTYVVSYGVNNLGMSKNQMLAATLVGAAVEIFTILWVGTWAKKIGANRITVISGIATVLVAFPVWLMVNTGNVWLVILAVVIGMQALSMAYGVNASVLTALFKPEYRTSGVSISCNLSAVVSGFVPMIATALTAAFSGSWVPAAIMLMIIGAITAVGGMLAPRFNVMDDGYKA